MDLAKEVARNLPSTDEIIRYLGLQARHNHHSDMLPGLALFGAGLLVGAGLALLFAPTTGRELREELGERAAELRDRVSATTEEAASQAHDMTRSQSAY